MVNKNRSNTKMDVHNHTCTVDFMSVDSFHSTTLLTYLTQGEVVVEELANLQKTKTINASQKLWQ